MHTHRQASRLRLVASLLALGAGLPLPGCASEGDLYAGPVVRPLQRGTRCAESPIIEGDVLVTDQAGVAALEGCQEVRGNLTIQLFASADLSPLSALTAVDGTLSIGQTAVSAAYADPDFRWEELDPELEQRDAALLADGWLESLHGLEALQRAGALFVQGTSVRDLRAFDQLRMLGGHATDTGGAALAQTGMLMLVRNPNLVDLSGLESLRGVDSVFIEESPSLESLSGLVLGLSATSIRLSAAPALVDLDALSTLTSISSLALSHLGVSDLSALSGLQRVEVLTVEDNQQLTDASGLRSPAVAFIVFSRNAALRSLPSFEAWYEIPDRIGIVDNPVLQAVNLDFGAFRSSLYVDNLERVMPATLVEIHGNRALQSVSVIARPLGDEAAVDDGLTSADFFLLSDNPSLRHIDFGGLHRVGLLSIANHPSLDMVTLGALARVEDLEVRDNPLLSDPPSTAWRPSSAR